MAPAVCSPHLATPSGPGAEQPATETRRSWVASQGGSLQYVADEQGNRIPDFSFVGYGGGGVALPKVPAAALPTLAPSGGDDTAAIQSAIDAVGKLPPDGNGWRGAVTLGPGTFTIAGTLALTVGGVVLRGAGEGTSGGTVLHAVGLARSVIVVGGNGRPRPNARPPADVTDEYVPVGASTLHVDSAGQFDVGMPVMVARPTTSDWICRLGMDSIPARSDGKPIVQWTPGDGLTFDRTVLAVAPDSITLDVPLTNALERAFAPSMVWAYDFPDRVERVGIESLRGRADFIDASPAYLSSLFIALQSVTDGWVAHVTADGFGNGAVAVGATAKRITIADSALVNPVIPQTSAPPAGFILMGQQTLLLRAHVTGDKLHAIVTQSEVAGPNVVLDAQVVGSDVDLSAHQRWATGLLVDRSTLVDASGAPSGAIAIQNRGNEGTGQGWAGANSVVWNGSAATFAVDDPPTAHNWVIGGTAGRQLGTAEFQPAPPGAPSSLFLAQLAARLGMAAVHALGY